jgi:hypothetical protein
MEDEIEIGILPAVPRGLTYEDAMLTHWSPCFGPVNVFPNEQFGRTLGFLGIGKSEYIAAVKARYGVDLRSSACSTASGDGPWTWTGEYAPRWQALRVPRAPRGRPPILGIENLFEIMENASYGGVLAIGGFASPSLVDKARALRGTIRITGHVQIGIIDYLWGSGHSLCLTRPLRLDLADGQIIEQRQMAYSWDKSCGFVRSYYRFQSIEPAPSLGKQRARFDHEATVGTQKVAEPA